MPSIYWRKPRTAPPQAHTRFDVDNSLNDGLVAVYAPSLFQGNLVTGRPFTSIPAGLTRTRMRWDHEAWALASTPLQDQDIPALGSTATLAVIARTDSSNTAQTLLSVGASDNSDNWLAITAQGNAPPEAQARNGGNIGTAAIAGSTRFLRAAMVGSFRGTNARALFVRAAEFDPAAPSIVQSATNTTAVTLAGNNRPVIGGLFRGGSIIQQAVAHQVSLGVISRIAWNDDESDRWLRNPWQLWAPEERRVWIIGSGPASYSLAADGGTYALTGQAAGLVAGRSLAADQGAYSLSGQAANLLRAYTVAAGQGSYALTGQDVALARTYLLTAGQGTYSLSGQTAGLLVARLLAAAHGTYSLTGQDAALIYTPVGAYSIAAGQGTYTLAGQAAGLLAARTMAAAQGAYALTGQDAGLTYTPAAASYTLTAEQGAYALTGQAAGFALSHVLAAASGAYVLAGQAATITYSGAPPAILPSAPPIGHGPALATRTPTTLRRRAPNLSTRTR